MPTYEITAVSPNVREWNASKGGPMRSYKVHLRDEQGNLHQSVEWSRKASSDPPVKGLKVDATIDTSGQYGPKLKVTPSGGFGGGGGRPPRDPAERRSIECQTAQHRATEIVQMAITCGALKPATVEEITSAVVGAAGELAGWIKQEAMA